MSDKRRKRQAEAKPFRDALIAEAGECEHCEASPKHPDWDRPVSLNQLCVHEIANGPNRQKALDKRYATLVLCWGCNGEDFEDKGQWPEARQLALLFQRRPKDFDLPAYLELTNPNAPNRITLDEVAAYMPDEQLTVTDVANLMKVNRRTVQTWIDSEELAATDARPTGGARAMWRIDYSDLMDFTERRRHESSAADLDETEENLLD